MRCGVEVASLRAEPSDAAKQVTQALRGDPLEAGEEREGWVAVTTTYGYPGWIRQEHLCGDDPLSLARTFLGTPYEWGGLSAAGIDCSGLVHLAYRLSGRIVPRDAWQQEEAGVEVVNGEERPGDLVTYGAQRADHIAFLVVKGAILHSTARADSGVIEEGEPGELAERRRRVVRL